MLRRERAELRELAERGVPEVRASSRVRARARVKGQG